MKRGACVLLAALVPLLLGPAVRADARCPGGNLAAGAPVEARETHGAPPTLTDGLLAREGWPPEVPQAVRLLGPAAGLTVDLGAPRSVRALLLQADGTAAYEVSGSTDGWSWSPVWRVPPAAADGLRTRTTELPEPRTVRHLRVVAAGGAGRFAVSELRAYCRVPASFTTTAQPFYAPAARPWLDRESVPRFRAAVAVAGLVVLLWGVVLLRAGRPEVDARLRDGLFAGLAIASALCFWNLGQFNHDDFVHTWDQTHYYLGSKYARELGYDGLYECLAVADLEHGLGAQVVERKIRNLRTNTVERSQAILADPGRCTRRFDAERWTAFKADVAWFRAQMTPELWGLLSLDHGYNPTPLWEAVGARLSNLTRAGRGTAVALALFDVALLAAMWAAMLWAFGWRATAAGLLWWGTNAVADYVWTGGSFLRMDWLALSVIGICLVRRGHPFTGAIALTWATLLRIFPGFIVLGLVLQVLATMARERRLVLAPSHRRFAAGCLVALAVLVPLSFTARGPSAWVEFARNSATHLRTPGTNTIGLGVVVAWEPSTRMELTRNPMLEDSDREWKAARKQVAERRAWLRWTLLAAYLALFAAAVARLPDWAALILGVGLIPFATVQSGYYFGVLLLFAGLWSPWRERIGAALCALSVCTHVAQALWPENVQLDQRFTWISVAVLTFVAALAAATWRDGRRAGASGEDPERTAVPGW